jgi:hypothetical protein
MSGRRDWRVREVLERSAWHELLDGVDHAHAVQSWSYGEAKRIEGWRPRRLLIEQHGQPAALAQCLDKRLGPLRLATRINRGPMWMRSSTASAEGYRALRRFLRPGGPAIVGPAWHRAAPIDALLLPAGWRRWHPDGWASCVLDLRLTSEQLRARLAQKWRNALNASERKGLSLQVSSGPEAIAWTLDKHALNMQAKGFVKPSPAFVRALAEDAGADFIVFQALAEGEAVAGTAVLRYGRSCEYYLGWYGPEGRKRSAGNFLLWNMALEMQRRGCHRFDLGGYSGTQETGYGSFKRGMNGEEYHLPGEWWFL